MRFFLMHLTPRQTISDRARDIAYSEVLQGTHDESSEVFSRTIAEALSSYRHYLSRKDLSPFSRAENQLGEDHMLQNTIQSAW